METTENKISEKSNSVINKDKLLEYGTHYGHETKRWNPAMAPFILKEQAMHNSKRKIHIISPKATQFYLDKNYKIIQAAASKGGTFLFVGTNSKSSKTVKENAERAGVFYVNHRWLGGTLTNLKTIQNSVKKLRNLERLDKIDFEGYVKKEASSMRSELQKLEKSLGGIKYMRRLPSAIFVTSVAEEDIVIREAKKLSIPVFGIVDTNVNPNLIEFPIPANDDANKSIALITTIIADAIVEAKGGKALVANVDPDAIEVLGIEELPPRELKSKFKPRFNRENNYSKNYDDKNSNYRTNENKSQPKKY